MWLNGERISASYKVVLIDSSQPPMTKIRNELHLSENYFGGHFPLKLQEKMVLPDFWPWLSGTK